MNRGDRREQRDILIGKGRDRNSGKDRRNGEHADQRSRAFLKFERSKHDGLESTHRAMAGIPTGNIVEV